MNACTHTHTHCHQAIPSFQRWFKKRLKEKTRFLYNPLLLWRYKIESLPLFFPPRLSLILSTSYGQIIKSTCRYSPEHRGRPTAEHVCVCVWVCATPVILAHCSAPPPLLLLLLLLCHDNEGSLNESDQCDLMLGAPSPPLLRPYENLLSPERLTFTYKGETMRHIKEWICTLWTGKGSRHLSSDKVRFSVGSNLHTSCGHYTNI